MKALTTEEFIRRANQIHNGKYDYSKFNYINRNTKSIIICPIHGEFTQTPGNHYVQNCPKCSTRGKSNMETAKKNFFKRSKEIHKNKYSYNKVEYKGTKKKVIILCPIHGEFLQTPNDHLNGYGCPDCGLLKIKEGQIKGLDKFIKEAHILFENKYDYSEFIYSNNKTKSVIKCPLHGKFEKTPNHHLNRKQGCPTCSKNNRKSTGERLVQKYLDIREIEYIDEYSFEDLLMKNKPYDFYLPELNILIEYHGEQHYKKKFSMNDNDLAERKQIDDLKKKFAEDKNIKLVAIRYDEDIDKILNSNL